MMRALLVLVLLASAARAELRNPSYVSGELRGTTAVFHARHRVEVVGPTYAWGAYLLWIPEGAAVTRITVTTPDGSHALKLVEAEQAKQQFEAINETPGGKRWAVLAGWKGLSVEISVAAPENATITIDLELQLPTCFHRDARYVHVPLAWKEALSPYLRTRTGAEVAGCNSDGDADETWVMFPSAELARTPDGARFGTNAGRIALGEFHFARLELAAGKSLGDVPRDLATAILVDTSRSMTPSQLEAQRELVLAYARAAGDTQLQLVAYARTAHAILPSWTHARTSMSRLDRALRSLAPRNGSNIDIAFGEAARWLAPHAGTKRVVVFTDGRVARRVRAQLDTLAKRLPADTLVHVVLVDEVTEIRRDISFGKRLAEGTGGIAVRAGRADDDKPIDATSLVRPVRIDDLDIAAPGWKTFVSSCTNTAEEGEACTWWGEGDAVAGPLAVTGAIWGKRFTRVVTPDPNRATELAREIVHMDVLDSDSLARARRRARALNEVWSFYGAWGGKGGYELGSISLSGGGRCCGRSASTHQPFVRIGHAGPGAPLPVVDLSPQFAHVALRCGLGDAHVEATIELTDAEIVDVTVLAPPAVARCVEDEIWETAVSPPPQARASARIVLVH